MKWLPFLLLLTGCSKFETNHSGDPKSCEERAAYHLAPTFPDPAALSLAINAACSGTGTTIHKGLPPVVTTTTIYVPVVSPTIIIPELPTTTGAP